MEQIYYQVEVRLKAKTKAITAYNSRQKAFLAANIADSKLGRDIQVMDVADVTTLADYFIMIGGGSATQVKAIAEAVTEGLSKVGYPPQAIEGKNAGRWILLDFGDLIIHILQEKERDYYKLEQFWKHALEVDKLVWKE